MVVRTVKRTVYHVLLGLGELASSRVRVERAAYDLLPSNRELAGAVSHAVGAGGRTVSLSPGEAQQAWGPLAGLLAAGPAVSALRAVVELGWTPRSPTLAHELVHGSLRRAPR